MFVRRHVVHIYCSVFMLVCLRERSSGIIHRRGGVGEVGQDEDLFPECHVKLSAQFKGSRGRKATKEYPLLILEYETRGHAEMDFPATLGLKLMQSQSIDILNPFFPHFLDLRKLIQGINCELSGRNKYIIPGSRSCNTFIRRG